MWTDCTGNSSGSDTDDDEEIESGISKEAALEIDEAERKVVKGGTGSGGRNAGSMFNSKDKLDEADEDVKDGMSLEESKEVGGDTVLVVGAEGMEVLWPLAEQPPAAWQCL